MSTLRILIEIDGQVAYDMPTTEVEYVHTQQTNGMIALPSDTVWRRGPSGERSLSIDWFDRGVLGETLGRTWPER